MCLRQNEEVRKFCFLGMLLLLWSMLLVAGCSGKEAPESTLTPTILPLTNTLTPLPTPAVSTPRQTIAPTVTTTYTPRSMFANPTGTETVISAIPPEVMSYQCLEISEDLPEEVSVEGQIIMNPWNETQRSYLWTSSTGETKPFFYEPVFNPGFNVSPDKKQVLYNGQNKHVIIANRNGDVVWSFIEDSSSIFYWAWINEKTILQGIQELQPQPNTYSKIFVIDLATEQNHELSTNYPYIVNRWSWLEKIHWSWPIVKYDPEMSKVIYPECDADCEERIIQGKPGEIIVLWDIKQEKAIARITMNIYGETPLWAPDGSQFFMASKIDLQDSFYPANEIIAVSSDGQVRQLTYFMDFFEDVTITGNYSLSPNGRFLAFWITALPGPFANPQLAIVDTITGHVVNYCVQGDPFDNAVGQESISTPIWSPDGTQLLIISRDPDNESRKRVILVDIVHNLAAVIAENVVPQGWMLAP